MRVHHPLVALLCTAVLTGCGPTMADGPQSATEPRATVAESATTDDPVSTTTEPPPPAEPVPPAITIEFLGEIEWPSLPPLPPQPASDALAGAWIQGSGGWNLHFDATAEQIQCGTVEPDGSTATSNQHIYTARSHPVGARPEGVPEMSVQINRVPYPDGPSAGIEIFWKEPGELRTRAGSGERAAPTDGKKASYGSARVSEDRRSITFAYVTFSEPGGYDTEKIAWLTVTGVITCPEPLPEIQRTPT